VVNAFFDNFGGAPDAAYRLQPRSFGLSLRKDF